jgi:glutamine amidotransferase
MPFSTVKTMIKIIDYKAGNAPSVLNAVAHLGFEAAYARQPQDITEATHIILPGVGSAKATMDSLRQMELLHVLEDAVLRKKVLFLGICVGMQILFEHSKEENAECLGWLKGRVFKFDVSQVRVPQMGWNQVQFRNTVLCDARADFFYFVNSYYAKPENDSDLWGTADYNGPFAAAVCRANIYATQFHVEKSGTAGLALLNGFLNMKNGDE